MRILILSPFGFANLFATPNESYYLQLSDRFEMHVNMDWDKPERLYHNLHVWNSPSTELLRMHEVRTECVKKKKTDQCRQKILFRLFQCVPQKSHFYPLFSGKQVYTYPYVLSDRLFSFFSIVTRYHKFPDRRSFSFLANI